MGRESGTAHGIEGRDHALGGLASGEGAAPALRPAVSSRERRRETDRSRGNPRFGHARSLDAGNRRPCRSEKFLARGRAARVGKIAMPVFAASASVRRSSPAARAFGWRLPRHDRFPATDPGFPEALRIAEATSPNTPPACPSSRHPPKQDRRCHGAHCSPLERPRPDSISALASGRHASCRDDGRMLPEHRRAT